MHKLLQTQTIADLRFEQHCMGQNLNTPALIQDLNSNSRAKPSAELITHIVISDEDIAAGSQDSPNNIVTIMSELKKTDSPRYIVLQLALQKLESLDPLKATQLLDLCKLSHFIVLDRVQLPALGFPGGTPIGELHAQFNHATLLICNAEKAVFWSESHKATLAPSPDSALDTNAALTADFSSAITAFLLIGKRACDAVVLSYALINQRRRNNTVQLANSLVADGAISSPTDSEQWPTHLPDYPLLKSDIYQDNFKGFPSTDTLSLGLYPVIDSLDWLKKLLELGVKTIQLRVKNVDPVELDEMIGQACQIASNYQARLFINDYWELAIKHKAYGIHLGQEDLEDTNLSAISAANIRLGVSTHSEFEWLRAIAIKPSYIAMGTVYPTQTKPAILIGLDNLNHWSSTLAEHYPIVAIGGIKMNNIDDVLKSGVGSIAVVTEITLAEDYTAATAALEGKQQRQYKRK